MVAGHELLEVLVALLLFLGVLDAHEVVALGDEEDVVSYKVKGSNYILLLASR